MNETQCNTKPAEPTIANASVPVLAKGVKVKRQLSYTQLNMFLRCPRQNEYRYLHGLKVPPSGAMIHSRVWH